MTVKVDESRTALGVVSRSVEQETLERAVREVGSPDRELRILEAGCGRRWPVDMTGVPHHLVGVDTDPDALAHRRDVEKDLHEGIVGDLREVDLPDESFDIIFCSYVLEHVEGAERVLERFVRALRPGGRIILRVPDGRSVFGFLTRLTPHWSHVAFKRYLRGNPDAGRPGHGPYPTVYDPVVSRPGLHEFARRHGLVVLLEYRTNYYLETFEPLRRVVDLALRGMATLSAGRLTAEHNNIGVVMQKPRH